MSRSEQILKSATQAILKDIASDSSFFQQLQFNRLPNYILKIQIKLCQEFKITGIFRNALNLNALTQLFMHAEQGCCIAMRHGEQAFDATGLDDEMSKIIQMRIPHNVDDEITERSAVEFIAVMVVFRYLQVKEGIQFSIDTSKNQRALQPAGALAQLLKINCKQNSVLDCVNYPNADVLLDAQLKRLLDKGALPWKKENVDKVCGEGVFDHICRNMKKEFKPQSLKPKQVRLMFTHTQQTNAICETHKKPVTRFNNYGFIGLDCKGNGFIFDQGIYQSIPKSEMFKEANSNAAAADAKHPKLPDVEEKPRSKL